jgi:hypothetical protein
MNTPDDGLEGKSPDSSYYESLTSEQRQHYDRQELFLRAYIALGRIYKAAEAADIPIGTVHSWQGRDTHNFNKRIERARQQYVESLEQLMDDRLQNPQGNRGSDVLLMFKLKAEAPQKYREEVKVIGIESSKQMMDRLREMAIKEREQQAALEAPAVEGEFKEVGEPRGEAPPMAASSPQSTGPVDQPPTVSKPKPGRYQRRREQPKGRFTRR